MVKSTKAGFGELQFAADKERGSVGRAEVPKVEETKKVVPDINKKEVIGKSRLDYGHVKDFLKK